MLSPADMVSRRADVLIDHGRLQEARRLLEKNPGQSRAERRRQDHLLGQLLMRQGQWRQAMDQLQLARQAHGDHILIFADLADCQMALGLQADFRETLSMFENTFPKVIDFLSFDTFSKASLGLGRLLEQQGQVARALDIYRQVYCRMRKVGLDDLTLCCLPDLVRLEACFGVDAHLTQDHLDLSNMEHFSPLAECNYRLQEALLLAELQVKGPSQAVERLMEIWAAQHLSPQQKATLLLSFQGEGTLRTGQGPLLTAKFRTMMNQLAGIQFNSEEQALLALLSLRHGEIPDLESLTQALAGLRLTSVLYLLAIAYQATTEETRRSELKSQWNLCLAALDEPSQVLWRGRIGTPTGVISVQFDPETREISFQGKIFSLRTRKNLYRLSLALSKKEEIPLEELTQNIWETSFNSSYYPRIRTAVQRLNKILVELTAAGKAVEVSKSAVRLSSKIQLQTL